MSTLFSGEKAYEHLRVLTDEIGPRHGGSKNEERAANYIYDYFKSLGLESRIDTYPIYSFEDATAELTTPDGKAHTCSPIPIHADTPAGGITKDVIFLEEANILYLSDDVRDKIVVTFNSFGGEALKKFLSYEPAALISIQTQAYRLHMSPPNKARNKRKFGAVPMVSMTLEDGLALIKDLPETLSLKVTTQDEKVTTGCNVIADLPGSSDEEDVIVVCAHFDSVWVGAGAVDNGGGTAGIMELARVYKEKGNTRNLRFIAFGGEEMGLWGAKGYVKQLKDAHDKLMKNKDFERDGLSTELDKIRFVVNLDMLGPYYGKSAAITLGDVDIAASVRLLSKELRYPINVRQDSVYSSDNAPFNYAGVPSLSLNRTGHGDWGGHTATDVIDNCSAEGLAHICCFVEQWIDRYLMAMHTFAFARRLPDAAQKVANDWFKGKNPLDYEVFDSKKQFDPAKLDNDDSESE